MIRRLAGLISDAASLSEKKPTEADGIPDIIGNLPNDISQVAQPDEAEPEPSEAQLQEFVV